MAPRQMVLSEFCIISIALLRASSDSGFSKNLLTTFSFGYFSISNIDGRVIVPCNRYVLIQPIVNQIEENSNILLPEDYEPEESAYVRAEVLDWANDCKIELEENCIAVVTRHMIEEVNIDDTTHYLVLENHIIAMIPQNNL